MSRRENFRVGVLQLPLSYLIDALVLAVMGGDAGLLPRSAERERCGGRQVCKGLLLTAAQGGNGVGAP